MFLSFSLFPSLKINKIFFTKKRSFPGGAGFLQQTLIYLESYYFSVIVSVEGRFRSGINTIQYYENNCQVGPFKAYNVN